MTSRASILRADAQFRILHALDRDPRISQRELARALGIGVGSAHKLLCALLGDGLIQRHAACDAVINRRGAYQVTARGAALKKTLARNFLIRRLSEFEALQAEIQDVISDLSAPELGGIRAGVSTALPQQAGAVEFWDADSRRAKSARYEI